MPSWHGSSFRSRPRYFPFLEIPNWCVRLVIVLLAARLSDRGDSGLGLRTHAGRNQAERTKWRRNEPVKPDRPAKGSTHSSSSFCSASIAVLIYPATSAAAGHRPQIAEKSIAVLPFDNLATKGECIFRRRNSGRYPDQSREDSRPEGDQPHIGDAVSRERRRTICAQIAEALGVTNVLEGSVRRGGNRVVVTVQLIDARNDHHIWANRYDRPLADSLGLQGELAAEIAAELRATLSPGGETCGSKPNRRRIPTPTCFI